MPQISDAAGVPTVNPEVRGIAVRADPSNFGSLIGQGLEGLGEGATKAEVFYGQVAASDAATTYIQGADAIQGKLRSLEGRAALDYLPEATQQINDLYNQAKDSLWTGESALQFDNEARRYHANALSSIADYGAAATKTYGLQTANRQGEAANSLAANATLNNDPASLAHAIQMARDAESNKMRIAGNADDPGAAIQARDDADRGIAIARIQAVQDTNPALAKQIFDANQSVLVGRPEFLQLQRGVEESYTRNLTATLSDPAAVAAARAAAPAANKPNVNEEMAANFVSNNFPGAQITSQQRSPEHNAAVGGVPDSQHISGQAIDFVGAPGTTLAQVKEKLAASGFPATEVLQEKNGSFHVGWAPKGGEGAPSQPGTGTDTAYLATVRAKAVAAGLGPAAVESVVKGVETNIKRDDSEQVQATEAHTQDAIAYLSAGGEPSKVAITPDQVRANVPGQRGDTLATELEAAQHYNAATKHLATAPQADVDKILEAGPVAKSLKGGAGDFDIHTKEENAIYSAAVARQKEIYGSGNTPGDPSSYVMRNYPDVAAAFTATTTRGADPASFQVYAKKTMAAQAALGIPADARRVMPRAAAVGTVSQLMTGDPAKVLPTLQGLRSEAGSYWPQMYTELSRAGLPPAYQALSVVNDQDAGVMAAALSHDANGRVKGEPPIVETMRGVKYDDKSGSAPKSVTDLVDLSLSKDGGLTNLKATYGIFGAAGAAQFSGIYDAVRTTALYLFQTRGIAPDAAAQTAAKMVTAPFDFVTQPGHPPVRLPKGATDNFRTASSSVLDALKYDDLQPYKESGTESGEAIAGQTSQELQDQTLQGAKHAYWISVPGSDGRGAIRAMDPQSGQPVMLKTGKPLDVPTARLPWLAQEAQRKKVSAEAAEDAMAQVK